MLDGMLRIVETQFWLVLLAKNVSNSTLFEMSELG